MRCIKCGKETLDNHVFCESCQVAMDHYPVKPDAAIHLPNRQEETVTKKAPLKKKVLSPEEQIQRLKKANRSLHLWFWILLLLLLASLSLVIYLAHSAGILPLL